MMMCSVPPGLPVAELGTTSRKLCVDRLLQAEAECGSCSTDPGATIISGPCRLWITRWWTTRKNRVGAAGIMIRTPLSVYSRRKCLRCVDERLGFRFLQLRGRNSVRSESWFYPVLFDETNRLTMIRVLPVKLLNRFL